tara:strand:+ start:5323 stop:8031 length:2709 start_codon:yes stop_codon:yes gene_type:complete
MGNLKNKHWLGIAVGLMTLLIVIISSSQDGGLQRGALVGKLLVDDTVDWECGDYDPCSQKCTCTMEVEEMPGEPGNGMEIKSCVVEDLLDPYTEKDCGAASDACSGYMLNSITGLEVPGNLDQQKAQCICDEMTCKEIGGEDYECISYTEKVAVNNTNGSTACSDLYSCPELGVFCDQDPVSRTYKQCVKTVDQNICVPDEWCCGAETTASHTNRCVNLQSEYTYPVFGGGKKLGERTEYGHQICGDDVSYDTKEECEDAACGCEDSFWYEKIPCCEDYCATHDCDDMEVGLGEKCGVLKCITCTEGCGGMRETHCGDCKDPNTDSDPDNDDPGWVPDDACKGCKIEVDGCEYIDPANPAAGTIYTGKLYCNMGFEDPDEPDDTGICGSGGGGTSGGGSGGGNGGDPDPTIGGDIGGGNTSGENGGDGGEDGGDPDPDPDPESSSAASTSSSTGIRRSTTSSSQDSSGQSSSRDGSSTDSSQDSSQNSSGQSSSSSSHDESSTDSSQDSSQNSSGQSSSSSSSHDESSTDSSQLSSGQSFSSHTESSSSSSSSLEKSSTLSSGQSSSSTSIGISSMVSLSSGQSISRLSLGSSSFVQSFTLSFLSSSRDRSDDGDDGDEDENDDGDRDSDDDGDEDENDDGDGDNDDGIRNNSSDSSRSSLRVIVAQIRKSRNPLVAAAPVCGNGILDASEECDDANRRDWDGCNSTCLLEIGICGDGIVQSLLGEQCESYTYDSSLPYVCSRCLFVSLTCGDGVKDAGEECDDGQLNSTSPDANCRPNCHVSSCGDAVLDSAEMCDDGNRLAGDGCDRFCRAEVEEADVTIVAAEDISFPTSVQVRGQQAFQKFGFPQYPNYQQLPYQLPLAHLQPLVQTQAPIGDTGPAAVAVIGAGAAAGWSWIRRKRK